MFTKKNEKNGEITITRGEFLKTFMEVISNPIGDNSDIPQSEMAQMQFATMMVGMLLMKAMDKKLFGEME